MTEEQHAITLDYEKTVEELRHARTTLITELDRLVDECDKLRTANHTLRYALHDKIENAKLLLETIDLLRSENERLKIALQTGEQ